MNFLKTRIPMKPWINCGKVLYFLNVFRKHALQKILAQHKRYYFPAQFAFAVIEQKKFRSV